jgi:tripartite-type tricarboxylate transporter receptor subunit TctC
MTMSRRHIMIAGAALLGSALSLPAQAQNWPERPINLIVPFAAGGGTDAFARPFANFFESKIGQRIVIDNRAGAGGTVGASAAAKAAPDGYTFFVGAAHHAIAPSLYPKLDYSIETDFEPVGILSVVPQIIVVHPTKVKAKTMAEFIAEAQSSRMNYGSAGLGTTHHLAGELFNMLAKTNITHVPYRGAGPALGDLVTGQIEVMFDGLGSSAERIKAGQLRAIAVADRRRTELLPDVPTAIETGVKDYEVSTWYAIFAPKGTPQPVIERMRTIMREIFKDPAVKDTWARNGSAIPDMWGEEMRKFVRAEVIRWDKVVKDAKVKLE